MTEKELRSAFVEAARSYIGKKEGSVEHKFIINTYNTIKPIPRGYKLKYTDDWCAGFVSAMGVLCAYTKIIPLECSCEEQIKILKANGAWVENDSYVPTSGDIIYYDWNDNGAGDNTGWADHVGIVDKVTGNTIRVIEGNKNNAVEYREIAVNARYIRGFGVPKYSLLADRKEEKSEADLAKEWAINNGLFKGDGKGNYSWKEPMTREQVAIVQYRLSKSD